MSDYEPPAAIQPYQYSLTPPFNADRPPQRVYISGYTYKLATPYAPRPPLAQTAKIILNWISTAGMKAKNILYALLSPPDSPSDVPTLTALANLVKNQIGAANIMQQVASTWHLANVTVRDNSGGSSNQVTDGLASLAGTVVPQSLPPQSAVCVSWQISASYRGGKPRTYVPGVPSNATTSVDSAQLTAVYASAVAAAWQYFQTHFNAATVVAGNPTLGTLSYFTGHALRPVPLFRQFGLVHVHERLDSQRRRSGKEATYPTVP